MARTIVKMIGPLGLMGEPLFEGSGMFGRAVVEGTSSCLTVVGLGFFVVDAGLGVGLVGFGASGAGVSSPEPSVPSDSGVVGPGFFVVGAGLGVGLVGFGASGAGVSSSGLGPSTASGFLSSSFSFEDPGADLQTFFKLTIMLSISSFVISTSSELVSFRFLNSSMRHLAMSFNSTFEST